MSLRIAKFHSKGSCPKKSEQDFHCLCPFTVIGPDPRAGKGRFKLSLGHRDQRKATAEMLEIETGLLNGKDPRRTSEPAGTSVAAAIDKFLSTKAVSPARLRDLRCTLEHMEAFLTARGCGAVLEVKKPDLDAFVVAGKNAITTRMKERQMIGEFWRYLAIADIIQKSPAVGLINVGSKRDRQMARRKIMTFTPDQMQAILRVADAGKLNPHYLGYDKTLGPRTRAFIYILAYSALSRIDVVTLSPEHIHYDGGLMATITKDRVKTGQTAHTSIPAFVLAMLNCFEPESAQYFFWSGCGRATHRAVKWWKRTHAVMLAAGVTEGKPHMFRHTKVRDMYMQGVDVRIIADTLGDSVQTVLQHYSTFDSLRQQSALDAQTKVALADPNYQRMSQVDNERVM